MLADAGPNWLGSPQHLVVGAILAFAVFAAARSRRLRLLADLASSLVGGLVGAAIVLFLVPRLVKRR
jgi:hypothetical protein